MKRFFLPLLLLWALPASAGSVSLLGAGSAGIAAPTVCADGSTLDIDWTAADGLGGFGVACVNGVTGIAVSTLGATSGTASVGASGLSLTSGFFNFTNRSWLVASTGTLYLNMTLTTFNAATVTLIEASDGTGNNEEAIRASAGTTDVGGFGVVGGVAQNNLAPGFIIGASAFKTAYSYTAGAQIVCAGGSSSGTGTGASTPGTYSQFRIGASPTGAGTWVGTVTKTKFFPTALASTAACNTLTTP